MATTQYRQGAEFENRVKERFEEAGYYVIRSAGSKGVADLVAFDLMADRITWHPVPIMIQCKRGEKGLGVESWNYFYAIAEATGSMALIAQKREGRTLEPSFRQITGTRKPRGRIKPDVPWTLRYEIPVRPVTAFTALSTDPETGVQVTDTALPGDVLPPVPMTLPHGLKRTPKVHTPHDLPSQLCDCGHGRDEHFGRGHCEYCYCDQFRAW